MNMFSKHCGKGVLLVLLAGLAVGDLEPTPPRRGLRGLSHMRAHGHDGKHSSKTEKQTRDAEAADKETKDTLEANAPVETFGSGLDSSCENLFLDVGSNIGVQFRKLFEPWQYDNRFKEGPCEQFYLFPVADKVTLCSTLCYPGQQ